MERKLGEGKQKGSAKDWHERERIWIRKGKAKEVIDRKKLGQLYHPVKKLSAFVHTYISIYAFASLFHHLHIYNHIINFIICINVLYCLFVSFYMCPKMTTR